MSERSRTEQAPRDSTGALHGAATAEGITEVRRQETLLKTGALQTAILNSANFSSIATDEKGVIQIFNVGAERMLGYAAAEVINKITPADISDPQELITRAQALSAELSTPITPGFEALVFKASRGIEDIYELTYVRKDLSRLPAVVSVTALRDAQNAIIGYLLIGTDNTARKQVEAERQRLDQVLQDKNAELENAKFVAEKANLAKSDFLSSMSHELRSPLNAILGFAQLMNSDSPPATDSQKASIDQILHAGWYLLELINEILDLSVIESGKLSLSEEPVALAEILSECRSMIAPQAQKRGITLAFPTFTAPCFVLADRTRLKQVMINLLSNAIKYNKPGGALAVEHVFRGPERSRISVRDTGAGLTPEKMKQLFQPFNRLGQERGAEEGTGIGLVMSKRLVELMGGVIGVESTAGIGSVFWFELSTVAEPTLVLDESHTLPAPRSEPEKKAPLCTLLYVEDNPANMKLVEQLIARRPEMRLLGAANGSLGVQIAREVQPEVILMDINLPGISGIEALRLIREDPVTAHIPVLAISANAMPGDIKRGLEAGFFRYLTKPIRVAEFMEAIDVALVMARSKLEPLAPQPALVAAQSGAREFKGLRVLLAEDDEANQFVATGFLSRFGFEVDVVSDGSQAIKLAGEGAYACILMDVQMAEMNGIEATRRIRAAAGGSSVRIIAMTANALSGDREALLAAGMNDYVSKPIERGALLEALRRQVLQPGAGAALPAIPGELETVDFARATVRLDLSREVLEGLLLRFANGLPRRLATLASAVAAVDYGAVHLHAHSLSGSAGSLAVDRLRWAAAALERAGRARSGPLDQLFATVEAEARTALDELAQLRAPPTPANGSAPLAAELGELARCLAKGDLTGIHTELARFDARGGESLSQLRLLVGNYQYDRAARLISELT